MTGPCITRFRQICVLGIFLLPLATGSENDVAAKDSVGSSSQEPRITVSRSSLKAESQLGAGSRPTKRTSVATAQLDSPQPVDSFPPTSESVVTPGEVPAAMSPSYRAGDDPIGGPDPFNAILHKLGAIEHHIHKLNHDVDHRFNKINHRLDSLEARENVFEDPTECHDRPKPGFELLAYKERRHGTTVMVPCKVQETVLKTVFMEVPVLKQKIEKCVKMEWCEKRVPVTCYDPQRCCNVTIFRIERHQVPVETEEVVEYWDTEMLPRKKPIVVEKTIYKPIAVVCVD